MFCKNCGNLISDNSSEYCKRCQMLIGNDINANNSDEENRGSYINDIIMEGKDRPNIIFNLISLLIPIIGFILYYKYKNVQPIKARYILKFTGVSIAIYVFLIIIILMFTL